MSNLKKLSNKQIEKTYKNILCNNPEVDEYQALLELNKYADFKKRKPVSEKRLHNFLESMPMHGDLTIDDNGNVSLSENSDFIKALKYMSVDSRHCYLRDHIYNFPSDIKRARVNVNNVLTRTKRLILVNDTFTDTERLSKNIDEYTSQFDTIKNSLALAKNQSITTNLKVNKLIHSPSQ